MLFLRPGCLPAPEERRGRGGASPPSRGNDAQPAQDQGAAWCERERRGFGV